MPMELGGVLKLLNGNPLKKCNGTGVIGEKFPLTKSLDGGAGLGGLMASVMGGGGLGSIIGNPMAAASGQLQGALSGAVGQLTSAMGSGASGLTAALGTLSAAAGNVSGAAGGLMSGPGIQDLIGHAGIADMVGSALPANLSLGTVLGPLEAHGLMDAISASVPDLVSSVVNGSMSVPDATAAVEAYADALDGIVAASSNALTTLTKMAPAIAAVSTAAAALVDAPPAIQSVLERAIAPDVLATMRASVAAHLDE